MRIAGPVVALALFAACAAPEREALPCPTVRPPVGLDPVQDVAGALRYAGQLQFHPGRPPHGERRALTSLADGSTPENPRFQLSVVAEVQPEICSHRNDPPDLQGESGRIVARIITSGPYPKLGLPADTSYLWVDRLVSQGDTGTARGVIIPANRGEPSVRVVRFERHPGTGANRAWAEARLLFTQQDDEIWETCVKFGCCYLEEGGPRDTVPGV